MPSTPDEVNNVLSRIDAAAVIDVLLITISIYWLLLLIRGTTAMTVLRGVLVLLVGAFVLSRVLDLRVVNWILRNSLAGLVIAIAIVFQPEIRRALERLGRTGLSSLLGGSEQMQVLDTVVRTSFVLARQHRGALILLERETGLQEVIDTGVPLQAEVSGELLVTVFSPDTPLHDGAVILRGERVVAAGCTLPLSDAPLPTEFGTRHRAALGITEISDAVVVVVSEERGQVSIASNGRMVTDLDERRLTVQLRRLFGLEAETGSADGSTRAAAASGAERRAS